MRISADEHARLKEAAGEQKVPEAELVRRAVNDWCQQHELRRVFDTKE